MPVSFPRASHLRLLQSNSSLALFRRQFSTNRPIFDSAPRGSPSNPKVSSNYTAPPTPKPRNQTSPLRVWPFVFIFATGTFLYAQIVKSRAGTAPPSNSSWRTLVNSEKNQGT